MTMTVGKDRTAEIDWFFPGPSNIIMFHYQSCFATTLKYDYLWLYMYDQPIGI